MRDIDEIAEGLNIFRKYIKVKCLDNPPSDRFVVVGILEEISDEDKAELFILKWQPLDAELTMWEH